MKKGRKIYFGLLLIIVFLISTMYFSYAFFTSKNEEHGKLNIVAGTLDYKIESNDLENNQITVLANEIEKVELSITSLNQISSKYELYYNASDNNDLEVGYSIDTKNSVLGEIESNSKKNITVIIKNNSDTDKIISFGVQGGLINNNLTLTEGKELNKEVALCNYEAGKVFTFDYTGNSQLFTTLCKGNYQVELWGASGGHYSDKYSGGTGGYTKGITYLEQAENFYIYVGQKNECIEGTQGVTKLGYNGGGRAGSNNEEWPSRHFCGGGGATDIRLTGGTWNNFNSLKSRIMVAGAGGGGNFLGSDFNGIGAASGGLIGYTGIGVNANTEVYNIGGTQTNLNFGYGGSTTTSGCGSGYYGGQINKAWAGGAGGSSFISGHDGCDAIKEESTSDNIIHTGQSVHYSGYSFRDTVMIDGEGYNWTTEKGNVVVGMPTHDGTSTMIGNSGNGYAKITYLGEANNIYDIYKIGDEVTLKDGSKWHVLEYSGNDNKYVTLLSDYNLNSDGTYNDECGRDIDGTYACGVMTFDSDNTNTYDESDSNNIGYFIKNTYVPLILAYLPGTTDVTLPTADQIALVDNQIVNESGITLTNSWLLTTNYWTKTAISSNAEYVWFVRGETSRLLGYYANTSHNIGVRPVITTLKSNIIDTMSSDTELAIGTAVEAVDGSKWHVLEASGSDSRYVTLLSDYNLNSDGTYNTVCQGISNNTSSYACSPMSFDSDNTNIYDESDGNNIGYFIKNTYKPLVTMLQTTSITLPTAEQITKADSQIFNQSEVTFVNKWLTTTNYWTKTASTSYNYGVWSIYGYNFDLDLSGANIIDRSGARPVITTLKTNLLAQ